PNPTGWVDPLGLNRCPGGNGCKPTHNIEEPSYAARVNEHEPEAPIGADSKLSRNGAFRRAKEIGGIPKHQHPARVYRETLTDQNRYTQGRVYEFRLRERKIEIREHSLGHKKGNHAPHFNTETTIKHRKVPLEIGDDSHTYFKE
ncbi:HNH/endonuclease VII fold putative polymorphic toxin, partial [Pseudomonas sp. O64]